MNKLIGTITNIQQSGSILLVDILVGEQMFSALLIESVVQPDWLETGKPVYVVFKETEVSLAKDISGQISMRNRMKCVVQEITRGDLLCKIKMRFHNNTIYSAITTRSVDAFKLAVGDEVEALVKANEVSLMKKQ